MMPGLFASTVQAKKTAKPDGIAATSLLSLGAEPREPVHTQDKAP